MSWQLNGTLLIACNCDYGCPCNFNALPTHRHCEGAWTWHVEGGAVDGTKLDGMNFAVFADWPGAIHEGGGKAIAYIDERANDAQRRAIETLVRGGVGGPWGIFINTYQLDGPKAVRFDVHLDGDRSRYRIGDFAELQLDTIKNPVTGAAVHPHAVLPEGLVTKDAALLRSETFRIKDAISYDHSGKYAALAPFAYSGS